MRRLTPMKASKPLAPPTSQLPRSPIAKVNQARKRKRKDAGDVYGPYHQWVGTLPCLLRGDVLHMCRGEVRGHHLLSVGAGGKDEGNEVPLCEIAHTLSAKSIHKLGPASFEEFWRVHLAHEAERIHEKWEALQQDAA